MACMNPCSELSSLSKAMLTKKPLKKLFVNLLPSNSSFSGKEEKAIQRVSGD